MGMQINQAGSYRQSARFERYRRLAIPAVAGLWGSGDPAQAHMDLNLAFGFDLTGYVNTVVPDAVLEMISQYHSGGSRNYGRGNIPELDTMLDKAIGELEETQPSVTVALVAKEVQLSPATVSRTYTSVVPFVSPATRSGASLWNTVTRPPVSRSASQLVPLAVVPEGVALRNVDMVVEMEGLANAIASIIAASQVFETCNDLDDDCDEEVDEDFPDKGNFCDDGGLGGDEGYLATATHTATDVECELTVGGTGGQGIVCN